MDLCITIIKSYRKFELRHSSGIFWRPDSAICHVLSVQQFWAAQLSCEEPAGVSVVVGFQQRKLKYYDGNEMLFCLITYQKIITMMWSDVILTLPHWNIHAAPYPQGRSFKKRKTTQYKLWRRTLSVDIDYALEFYFS